MHKFNTNLTQISYTMFVYLYVLYKTPTRFGQISWPFSGSYKFNRRVQRI